MVSSIRTIKSPGREFSAEPSMERALLVVASEVRSLSETGASLLKVASDTYAA
ncbi:hypothetical protein D3C75_438800 [compost metagenome]